MRELGSLAETDRQQPGGKGIKISCVTGFGCRKQAFDTLQGLIGGKSGWFIEQQYTTNRPLNALELHEKGVSGFVGSNRLVDKL